MARTAVQGLPPQPVKRPPSVPVWLLRHQRRGAPGPVRLRRACGPSPRRLPECRPAHCRSGARRHSARAWAPPGRRARRTSDSRLLDDVRRSEMLQQQEYRRAFRILRRRHRRAVGQNTSDELLQLVFRNEQRDRVTVGLAHLAPVQTRERLACISLRNEGFGYPEAVTTAVDVVERARNTVSAAISTCCTNENTAFWTGNRHEE